MVTEAEIAAWARASPRDYDQKCQALVWQLCNRFGRAPTAYASAREAYRNSIIEGRDLTEAPAGAFGYWGIGVYDHVAFCLGDDRWFMASRHPKDMWGSNVGVIASVAYQRITGADPLGWSFRNGENEVVYSERAMPMPMPLLTTNQRTRKKRAMYLNHLARRHKWRNDDRELVQSRTSKDGVIDPEYNWLMKRWGRAKSIYGGAVTTVSDAEAGKTTVASLGRHIDPDADEYIRTHF